MKIIYYGDFCQSPLERHIIILQSLREEEIKFVNVKMINRFNIRGVLLLFIFLPVFLIQSWKVPMVYVWYYGNKEAITDQFCINKSRPELMCSGKCHIRQVIEKYESSKEDWKNLATKSIDKNTLTLIKETYPSMLHLMGNFREINASFIYLFNYFLSTEKSIFRPPRCS